LSIRHNCIEPGSEIGSDPELDARRYHVTPGGVVVIARGDVSCFARDSRGQGPGYSE
jgi:glucose-1-phosphate adenylyltransferase